MIKIRKYTHTGWVREEKANNGFTIAMNSLTAWVQSEMLGWLKARSLPCLQYLNAVAYRMPCLIGLTITLCDFERKRILVIAVSRPPVSK